jgi:hypothetical protein
MIKLDTPGRFSDAEAYRVISVMISAGVDAVLLPPSLCRISTM